MYMLLNPLEEGLAQFLTIDAPSVIRGNLRFFLARFKINEQEIPTVVLGNIWIDLHVLDSCDSVRREHVFEILDHPV
jgi:hypothetical protein